jgi:hypothetical protein
VPAPPRTGPGRLIWGINMCKRRAAEEGGVDALLAKGRATG